MNVASLELLLGTGNREKAAEICNALGALDIHFLTLENFPQAKAVAVKESGATYEENAILKASGYAQQSHFWTLADDSGLEVEALNGAPGVLSARYAGAGASNSDRIDLLLAELGSTPTTNRAASFISVLALSDPDSKIIKVESGVCEGIIANSPRGSNGFGYDPIFIPQGFNESFAELSFDIKSVISHRRKALRAMRHFLAQLVG